MTAGTPTRALRWGILGTGRTAHDFARDVSLIDEGEVVAVGSRSQASANRFGEECGIAQRHGSYEALVSAPAVDAVYVATPHPMHLDNALLAIEHGKPVLVEKSFTMNADQARELVAAARSKGLFAMEAMWSRFLPHMVQVRELLDQRALGEVVAVFADHGKWFAPDPSSRLFSSDLGGGALLDLGVYAVSFASMVLGTPERVAAMVQPSFTGVDGLTSMILGYPSGAQAVLTCTSGARSANRAVIVGTEARIELDGDFYSSHGFEFVSRDGARTRHETAHPGRGLQYQAIEVARCIAAGQTESVVMPLEESISIMDTMDRVLSFL